MSGLPEDRGSKMRSRSLRLKSQVVAVRDLLPETRDSMWALFQRFYADVSRDTFDRDLAAKNDVILLRDSGDRSLEGFSTIQVYDRVVMGRRFIAVFSGDTIISPDYWGQTALQRAFLGYVMRVKLTHPFVPVYWFLISKGYKTYLLLARNFPEYWPRHDAATPAWQHAVLDRLASEKYGEAWKRERGVLQFTHGEGRLRSGVAPIEASLLERDDVRFFVEKNPGHASGDELVCIGRVGPSLWTAYMSKLSRRALEGVRRGVRRLWASS